jgi:hypothetical protein
MRSSASGAVTWAAILAVLAAAGGWGAYFLVSQRAVATEMMQARELKELRQSRAELERIVADQQAKAAELAELDRRLQAARDSLDRTREAHEKAQTTLAAVQNEVSSRRTELTKVAQQLAQTREEQARAEQAAAEETASVEKAKPREKRSARKSKRGKRYAKSE